MRDEIFAIGIREEMGLLRRYAERLDEAREQAKSHDEGRRRAKELRVEYVEGLGRMWVDLLEESNGGKLTQEHLDFLQEHLRSAEHEHPISDGLMAELRLRMQRQKAGLSENGDFSVFTAFGVT
jgi:hypothetical protein